jgi:hypothetical protein
MVSRLSCPPREGGGLCTFEAKRAIKEEIRNQAERRTSNESEGSYQEEKRGSDRGEKRRWPTYQRTIKSEAEQEEQRASRARASRSKSQAKREEKQSEEQAERRAKTERASKVSKRRKPSSRPRADRVEPRGPGRRRPADATGSERGSSQHLPVETHPWTGRQNGESQSIRSAEPGSPWRGRSEKNRSDALGRGRRSLGSAASPL